jgi:uncharacterized protein YjbJ (UPF0337 family)
MGGTDKIKDKAQQVRGKAKEEAGQALDDPYLEGKGKSEKVAGNLKQAGEKVKDAFR